MLYIQNICTANSAETDTGVLAGDCVPSKANLPLDLCAAGRYTIQVNKVAVADAALTLRAKGRRVHTKERAAGRASLFVQCGLLPRKPYFFSQAGSPRRNRNIWRCFTISGKKEMEINEGIRDREVRVIDADGSQLGIMSTRDALAKAEEKNLDLVKIAPQAQPPVCKFLDYGKYRFEMQKRDKEAKKNQKIVDIKEIRLSLNIDTNDFNTKVGQAKKFLSKGDKVKVSIRFRGREMAHTDLGLEVQKKFAAALPEAVVEKQPKLEGRSMQMFLAPAPAKQN